VGVQSHYLGRKLIDNYLQYLADIEGASLAVNLFRNDFTPLPSSVSGDFVAANFDGYAEVTFNPTILLPPATVDDVTKSKLTIDPATFTCTGTGQLVYGVYVVADNSVNWLWAERFSSPILVINGTTIRVIPFLGQRDATTP